MSNINRDRASQGRRHNLQDGLNKRGRIFASLCAAAMAAVMLLAPLSASAVEPLRANGNKVLAGGQVRAFGGHSLFWHNVPAAGNYYNADTVSRLKNDWNSKIIRAAIGVDAGFNDDRTYLGDPQGSLAAVDRVVNAAVANDMYVIIDFHSHHADEWEGVAHEFFATVASRYGHLDNVIYEVFNEPEWCDWDGAWAQTIKPYAERVIGTIRAHDPDNLVIVGTRCYSQRVDEAAANPINDFNVAYTLHYYAASHKQDLRNIAQAALNMNAPLFVTEWGSTSYTGDGFVDEAESWAWVNWLNERGISHVNWSASSQPEASAVFNANGSYTQSGLLVGDLVSHTNGPAGGGGGDGDGDITEGPCQFHFLPGHLEAESYCHAGGMQFQDTTDAGGGSNMGWVDPADWITYDVNVPVSGQYRVTYRVASLNGGGRLRLEEAGGVGAVFGAIDLPNTGGWQNWVDVQQYVTLGQGNQTIAIVAEAGGWNLNWFRIENVNSGGGSVTVEAENFSQMQGVIVGGTTVGWIDPGDWMTYTNIAIPASASGQYRVSYRVARGEPGQARFKLEQPGGAVNYGEIAVPDTGGWDNYTTISHVVNLPGGTSALALAAIDGGWNIDWFTVEAL